MVQWNFDAYIYHHYGTPFPYLINAELKNFSRFETKKHATKIKTKTGNQNHFMQIGTERRQVQHGSGSFLAVHSIIVSATHSMPVVKWIVQLHCVV
jgi:hypothetical protein